MAEAVGVTADWWRSTERREWSRHSMVLTASVGLDQVKDGIGVLAMVRARLIKAGSHAIAGALMGVEEDRVHWIRQPGIVERRDWDDHAVILEWRCGYSVKEV